MAQTTELLDAARRFHKAGDLSRAEQAYQQILQTDPHNAQVWYLLGALCVGRGDQPAAVANLERALRLQPTHADALNQLGVVFAQQGQMAAATARFREALRLRPIDAEIQTNLGLGLARQGQQAEAVALFRAVLQRQPDYGRAQTHLREALAQQAAGGAGSPTMPLQSSPGAAPSAADYNREGLACLEQGKLDVAAACFRQALRLRPDLPEAYNNLGYTLAGQRKLDEAIACYQQALRLRPEFGEAHNNLGIAYRYQKRLPEAEAACREAVRLRPHIAEAQNNLGLALLEQGRLLEAKDCLERAVQLKLDFAESRNNLGIAFWRLARLEEAAQSLEEALRLRPNFAEALNNLANVLRDQGHCQDALARYADALQAKPDYADPHWNAALVWLLLGDFEKGWPEYEWRLRRPDFHARSFDQPRWDGSSLAGRTILLYAEQGLGDTIQFVRYARLLKEQGARVILESHRPLLRVLAGCPGIDQLIAQGDPLPPHGVRAPLLSLPYHFKTRLETIPAEVPYLAADPGLVEHWGRQLATLRGFTIGIAWQGNRQYPGDQQRSMELAEFAPLAAVPGVRLVSLQKGTGSEQVAALAKRWPLTDLGGSLDEKSGPFMDTAAVIKTLDLVVTADTAIAHLAGALGAPVWLALAKVPDWRWLLERQGSPWYPTMRLFRQEKRGEWKAVFQRMAQAVRPLLMGKRGATAK
jgi:tetratricopeptide (TPR) repeat protein